MISDRYLSFTWSSAFLVPWLAFQCAKTTRPFGSAAKLHFGREAALPLPITD